MTQITESQFYMWRTVFAMAHADHIVTKEELRFMVEALEDVPFSEEQRRILGDDIATPQNIMEMFEKITDAHDRSDFFDLARKLVWIDGDYGPEERDIMLKLNQRLLINTDVDSLVGTVDLELEDDNADVPQENVQEAMYSFKDTFLKRLFKG